MTLLYIALCWGSLALVLLLIFSLIRAAGKDGDDYDN